MRDANTPSSAGRGPRRRGLRHRRWRHRRSIRCHGHAVGALSAFLRRGLLGVWHEDLEAGRPVQPYAPSAAAEHDGAGSICAVAHPPARVLAHLLVCTHGSWRGLWSMNIDGLAVRCGRPMLGRSLGTRRSGGAVPGWPVSAGSSSNALAGRRCPVPGRLRGQIRSPRGGRCLRRVTHRSLAAVTAATAVTAVTAAIVVTAASSTTVVATAAVVPVRRPVDPVIIHVGVQRLHEDIAIHGLQPAAIDPAVLVPVPVPVTGLPDPVLVWSGGGDLLSRWWGWAGHGGLAGLPLHHVVHRRGCTTPGESDEEEHRYRGHHDNESSVGNHGSPACGWPLARS